MTLHGKYLNRECANCTPPCQGGEVLHRNGYCSHSYCLCVAFEPVVIRKGFELPRFRMRWQEGMRA